MCQMALQGCLFLKNMKTTRKSSKERLKQLSVRSLLWLIDLYQRRVSPLLKPACIFYPTCSEYMKLAVEKYGAGKGTRLGLLRILRCHPWQKKHIDPLN